MGYALSVVANPWLSLFKEKLDIQRKEAAANRKKARVNQEAQAQAAEQLDEGRDQNYERLQGAWFGTPQSPQNPTAPTPSAPQQLPASYQAQGYPSGYGQSTGWPTQGQYIQDTPHQLGVGYQAQGYPSGYEQSTGAPTQEQQMQNTADIGYEYGYGWEVDAYLYGNAQQQPPPGSDPSAQRHGQHRNKRGESGRHGRGPR